MSLSSSFLKPTLEFLAAVGFAYTTVYSLSLLASSSNRALLTKSAAQNTQNSHHVELCPFCISRIEKLQKSVNAEQNQLQLQLAVLLRLLKDRHMLPSIPAAASQQTQCSCHVTNSDSSSTSLMIPLPLLSLDSNLTTFRSLDTPTNFYETLLEKISSARSRIVISSLYIGSGPRSVNLVATIARKLKQSPELEVLIVLDYCRMQIGSNLNAILPILDQIGENAKRFDVQDKISRSGNQRVALFCPPSAIGRAVKKFGRMREAQGVQHTKLFVFDQDVILSGANLSDDYFLDRMDRYILVEHSSTVSSSASSSSLSSPLADHVVTLAKTVASISFQLFPQNNNNDDNDSSSSSSALRPCCNGKMLLAPNHYGTDPDQANDNFTKSCESAMVKFEEMTSMSFDEWMNKLEKQQQQQQQQNNNNNQFETFIIPSVQFARAGVFSDMSVMETLLSFETSNATKNTNSAAATSVIQRVIASPYLNTHEAFLDKMFQVCEHFARSRPNDTNKNQNKLFRFVTCSPDSNAWKGSRGVAGLLPQLYYSLVRSFYFLAEDRNFAPDLIQVREFSKFHLVDHNGQYSNFPDGVSVGVFSPYVRPDDEDFKVKVNNNNKANYFPRSRSSAERFVSQEEEEEEKQQREAQIKNENSDRNNSRKMPQQQQSEEQQHELELRVASATFHAKGVWVAAAPTLIKNEEQANDNTNAHKSVISTLNSMSDDFASQPFATVVGSNNLGERCVYKDLESDYLVITSDRRVQRTLAEEVSAILKHSKPVSRNDFLSNSSDGKLGRFQPVIEVVGSMMASYL